MAIVKVTSITVQHKDPNRVNISVDGTYRFSLDIFQVSDLGVRVGKEYTESELSALETESQYGKLYARALDYCLMRPHSDREVRDYLYRKTLTKKYRDKKTGDIVDRAGVSQSIADRVHSRLVDRGYVDDEKFTKYWVENRNQTKGTSIRKLEAELAAKGVDKTTVHRILAESERNDEDELKKIMAKKRSRYPDDQKFMQYLARQGFSYDDIKSALSRNE